MFWVDVILHFLVLGPTFWKYHVLYPRYFYLHHRRILSDGRLLFFSIIVKFLIKQIRMKNTATTSINEKSTEEGTGPSSVGG